MRKLSIRQNIGAVPIGPIAGMLFSVSAAAGVPSKKLPPEENGETLWLENCWQCHGKRALGDGPLAQSGPTAAPPLAGRVPATQTEWLTVIHRGRGSMPAFAPVFDRTAAKDILTWLNALDSETGAGPSIEAEKAKKKEEAEKAREQRKAEKQKARADDADADVDPSAGDAEEKNGMGPNDAPTSEKAPGPKGEGP